MARHFCASVFLINPEDKRILLVKHKKFNKWVQPGGHIEDEETPEEAALRETYEETGIKVKLLGERFPREDDFIKPLGIQKNRNKEGDVHIDIIYAGIPINDDEAQASDESIDIHWFTRKELDYIDLFPDIKITYDYIINEIIK
ncbi:MAG: NUDIX hydrolase [Bacilli bacterium]|jgi:8-oxo-dGTP pyrophosphatase MutT (NUDIX family)|nr:NUDIX hydrolase [Bacilli bacterium]